MVEFLDSDDVARRSKLIYELRLREELERTHLHKFVAIEPDSGEYFIGATLSAAIHNAQDVYSDRLTFVERIGHKAAVHFGYLVLVR